MRIGFIGLGRMGANMVRRLVRDGHEIVAYNRTPEKTKEIAGEGAIAVVLDRGAGREAREAPRGLDHGPGRRRDRGPDRRVDGAPRAGRHDRRRWQLQLPRRPAPLPELKAKGINYVDAGVSGGIWGLQVGYCLMVGGDEEAVEPLEPIFTSLAPTERLPPLGGPGAGHYVKMVHNGIEYGLMQAYAEGFEIMHASDYDLDLAAISELWMQGSVVRSWLLELAGRAFRANGKDLEQSRVGSPTPARAAGRSRRRSTRTCPAPVITLSLRRASARARTTRTAPRSSPRCATSSAGTR